jgi:hypothetical protein
VPQRPVPHSPVPHSPVPRLLRHRPAPRHRRITPRHRQCRRCGSRQAQRCCSFWTRWTRSPPP